MTTTVKLSSATRSLAESCSARPLVRTPRLRVETFGLVSTFHDLLREREVTERALVKQGRGVLSLQEGARCLTAEEVCQQEVAEYDAIIVILAYCYGSIVPGTGVSYTETEIRAALRKHKPILAFAISEERGKKAGIHHEDGTAWERARVRALLQRYVVLDRFENAEDLATKVLAALSRLDGDYQRYLYWECVLNDFLSGRIEEGAIIKVMMEPLRSPEIAPIDDEFPVETGGTLWRAFSVINGIDADRVWVYFDEPLKSKIDCRAGELTKIECRPFITPSRRGLLVEKVLTPADFPAALAIVDQRGGAHLMGRG